MRKICRIGRVDIIMLGLVLFAVTLCILSIVPNSPLFPPRNNLYIIGTADPPGDLDESLTITANAGHDTITQRKYAGQVMIQIRDPQLQVAPTPTGVQGYVPVGGLPFSYHDFWIDDYQLSDMISLDQHGIWTGNIDILYHPVYGYQMLYTVGDNLHTIAFRIENPKLPDTQSFEILVSIENRYSFGR